MHDDPPSRSFTPEGSARSQHTSAARAVTLLVMKTLSHYWTADDHEATREAQVADWIEDLVEFGATIVNEALRGWRQSQNRRPTIADIRIRCIEIQSEARERGLRIEDHRAPWPGWLKDAWGDDGQLERRDAIALQQARYLRGEIFRGKPVDWIAQVSAEQLRQQFAGTPDEVITRAFDLICETNRNRQHKEA